MIRELNVEGHKNKVKIENTLGMFDLLKGVVMFIMVLFHNRSVFPELVMDRAVATTEKATVKFLGYGYELAVFARIVFSVVVSFGISLMPALMVLGGYGFRKRKISKALSGLTVEILIPYIFTMVVTTVAHFFLHYAFFNYFRGAVEESFKVLGGMMLGLSQTSSFGSVVLFANGPIWYLLATFWSLFTFDIVLNIANERHVVFYVGGISIAGWLLSYIKYVPLVLHLSISVIDSRKVSFIQRNIQ